MAGRGFHNWGSIKKGFSLSRFFAYLKDLDSPKLVAPVDKKTHTFFVSN